MDRPPSCSQSTRGARDRRRQLPRGRQTSWLRTTQGDAAVRAGYCRTAAAAEFCRHAGLQGGECCTTVSSLIRFCGAILDPGGRCCRTRRVQARRSFGPRQFKRAIRECYWYEQLLQERDERARELQDVVKVQGSLTPSASLGQRMRQLRG